MLCIVRAIAVTDYNGSFLAQCGAVLSCGNTTIGISEYDDINIDHSRGVATYSNERILGEINEYRRNLECGLIHYLVDCRCELPTHAIRQPYTPSFVPRSQ